MSTFKLESAHYEDLEDLISCVEREFNIKFSDEHFMHSCLRGLTRQCCKGMSVPHDILS